MLEYLNAVAKPDEIEQSKTECAVQSFFCQDH